MNRTLVQFGPEQLFGLTLVLELSAEALDQTKQSSCRSQTELKVGLKQD